MAEMTTTVSAPLAPSALISAPELAKLAGKPGTVLLDASYGLPPAPGRIADAIPFDIDEVADPEAALPHTMPSAQVFSAWATAAGIGNDDRVVVYDRAGVAMAAARAWWMFRAFGHARVQLLDGGLPAWQASGLPLENGPLQERPKKTRFKAIFRAELLKKRQDMLDNISRKSFTVADARDGARYRGEAPEPRPGMAAGHIPGALSVPYASLLDPATGQFRTRRELEKLLAVLDAAKPVAVSCGSGVTACVVALALHLCNRPDAAVYGGSWAEWGGDPALPKVRGAGP
jgi:thiosulfate/3-mercaptopyruvate sulfurtransferase